MTFFAIPIRDQVQFEHRLLELRTDNAGFEVSFPGDYADSMFATGEDRTNSFDKSADAQFAAALAVRMAASITKKIGG